MRLPVVAAGLLAAVTLCEAWTRPARAADVPAVPEPSQAVHPTIVARGAVTGVRQRIAFLYQENPGCGSEGMPVIHTLLPPQHGKMETAAADKYPYFTASQMLDCNLRTVSGAVIYYTSAPGFLGEDSVTMSVIYPDGGRYVFRYQITVESAG